MIFFLDTSDLEEAQFKLFGKNFLLQKDFLLANKFSEQLYKSLQKFLRQAKIKPTQLTKIAVVIGPGPFSRIRAGVVVANALAYGLGLKVIPLRVGQHATYKKLQKTKGKPVVYPLYGREPNISKPIRQRQAKTIRT